jgi:hypothetical protein
VCRDALGSTMNVVPIEFNTESKKSGPRGYGTVGSPIDWCHTSCRPDKVSSDCTSELPDKVKPKLYCLITIDLRHSPSGVARSPSSLRKLATVSATQT